MIQAGDFLFCHLAGIPLFYILKVIENWVFRSLTLIVESSIFTFNSRRFCSVYFVLFVYYIQYMLTVMSCIACFKTIFVFNNQFSSVTQSCLILCDPMDRSMPGLPVHHQLPESTQTHVRIIFVKVYFVYCSRFTLATVFFFFTIYLFIILYFQFICALNLMCTSHT